MVLNKNKNEIQTRNPPIASSVHSLFTIMHSVLKVTFSFISVEKSLMIKFFFLHISDF